MVKNLIKMLLCATILLTTGILAYSSSRNGTKLIKSTQDTAYNYNMKLIEDTTFFDMQEFYINYKKDSLRNLMVNEVQNFICKNSPKAHSSIAPLLVDNGLDENIDIAFMMAQAQYETRFGTTGAGRTSSRHSLFGVNGDFTNYSDAVTKYIQLLKNNYLTKGRTEQDLLHKYTTSNGSRYSTNPSYEATLRKYYRRVTNVSNIRDIQKKYNSLVI